jgi:hypothetical protein
MSDRLPMEHIERCMLPWQSERLTECGKHVEEFAVVLTREQAARKFREQGQQRAALTTCITCMNRGQYQPLSWGSNPAAVMSRACDHAGWRPGDDHPMNVELRALALLVEAHRDEFDEAVAALKDSASFAAARRARATQRRRA